MTEQAPPPSMKLPEAKKVQTRLGRPTAEYGAWNPAESWRKRQLGTRAGDKYLRTRSVVTAEERALIDAALATQKMTRIPAVEPVKYPEAPAPKNAKSKPLQAMRPIDYIRKQMEVTREKDKARRRPDPDHEEKLPRTTADYTFINLHSKPLPPAYRETKERAMLAADLRAENWTYEDIGKHFKVTKWAARSMVSEGLAYRARLQRLNVQLPEK